MKLNLRPEVRTGYMLVEALVYIGVSFLLLGVGFAAMYRCIDNSVGLRRSADDITSALHAGERWREDVRGTVRPIQLEKFATEQVLHLPGPQAEIVYRYSNGAVFRRVGSGGWTQLLSNISLSTVQADKSQSLVAWRWELELKTRAKASRIRPLFTFIAVPARTATP